MSGAFDVGWQVVGPQSFDFDAVVWPVIVFELTSVGASISPGQNFSLVPPAPMQPKSAGKSTRPSVGVSLSMPSAHTGSGDGSVSSSSAGDEQPGSNGKSILPSGDASLSTPSEHSAGWQVRDPAVPLQA